MRRFKTRPIGEIFVNREVKLKVVEKDDCIGCYFRGYDDCFNYRSTTGYCGGLLRNDNTNVIFKRIIE